MECRKDDPKETIILIQSNPNVREFYRKLFDEVSSRLDLMKINLASRLFQLSD